MAELLKLPTCVLMAGRTVGFGRLSTLLAEEVWGNLGDTLKCAVPAVAFTLQGNLLFLALANLEAPTYQVVYQCKTVFTAVFSLGCGCTVLASILYSWAPDRPAACGERRPDSEMLPFLDAKVERDGDGKGERV